MPLGSCLWLCFFDEPNLAAEPELLAYIGVLPSAIGLLSFEFSFSMSRRASFPTRPDFARGARAWAQAEALMHFELLKLLDGHRGAMRHAGGRTAASC